MAYSEIGDQLFLLSWAIGRELEEEHEGEVAHQFFEHFVSLHGYE